VGERSEEKNNGRRGKTMSLSMYLPYKDFLKQLSVNLENSVPEQIRFDIIKPAITQIIGCYELFIKEYSKGKISEEEKEMVRDTQRLLDGWKRIAEEIDKLEDIL
jgi:hypothetical protein